MEQQGATIWVWTLVAVLWVLPLFTFVAGIVLSQKRLTSFGKLAASALVAGAVLSWALFFFLFGAPDETVSVAWWTIGAQSFNFSLAFSPITRLMLVVVYTVSALVHVYSIEYMKADPGKTRYFAWLGFFTFAMLGIVLADSLLLMFFFWELVGAASYFLIGFWFRKSEAGNASFKAFIVNRVGDLGFLIGLCLVYSIFHTLNISEIQSLVEAVQWKGEEFNFLRGEELISSTPFMFTVVAICLFGGAVGKSAQFPLQVWLPDAMQGPTPVSALIHAATMVAAGIYFVARIFFLFTPDALFVVAVVGGITALMGAVAAVAQFDIKKVLAFSTISQLGFMTLAIGVGGREESVFHLTTHAAFKAGLFLAAGSIIHALHASAAGTGKHFDVQDIRYMGGLRRYLPVTFATFLVFPLANSGIPLFSGFLSKDAIVMKAFLWASAQGGFRWLVPVLAMVSALLTAFYMSRLVMLVFFGSNKTPGLRQAKNLKENNGLITVPLIVLAVGSAWIWFNPNPFGDTSWLMELVESGRATISGLYLETTADVPHKTIVTLSVLLSLTGIGLGYALYDEEEDLEIVALEEQQSKPGFWSRLSANNWYLNELYDQTAVYAFRQAERACVWLDTRVIDRAVNITGATGVMIAVVVSWWDRHVVDGLVKLTGIVTDFFGNIARSIQGGAAQKYIAWSLFFALLVIAWVLIK